MRTNLRLFALLLCLTGLTPAIFAEKPSLSFNTQDFRPFSYLENGKVAGPGVEILERVCQTIHADAVIRMFPWTRAITEAQDGLANGLFFLGKSTDREAWLNFSPPLIHTEYGVFVTSDNPHPFKEMKDLHDLTIGVYGPSNTATSLQNAIKGLDTLKIDMTPDDESAFKKLDIKRIGAVYSNRDVGLAVIRNLKLDRIRYAGTHTKLNYYIALTKKTDPALSAAFFEALAALEKDGTIKKILDKYHMN